MNPFLFIAIMCVNIMYSTKEGLDPGGYFTNVSPALQNTF